MKTFLLTLLAVLASPLLHAQTVQTATFPNIGSGAARTQDIAVPAGQTFRLLMWSPAYNGPTALKVDGVDLIVSTPTEASNITQPAFLSGLVIAGPRTVSLVVPSNTSLICSYQLESNESIGTTVPSTAVVIPTDATGPIDIILESSTDLITWTAATPGTYGSSTTKRFFRVRAVAH